MNEKPMLGGCCVCLDERGWAENPLVYCDGQSCNVAVHQACYGIIKVPSGPWFCRKCESQERAAKVKCELCPHRDGALKRTDGGGWAHVVCALYIPEVIFGSVSSMEPIILQKVPPERFNKTCYICEENNRSSKANSGACMTCAKQGCKSSFHVTCAQMTGLLCEEASWGNQTKYCGYCKAHLSKVKKTSSFKSLSCTKVYKLPTTSSSDELTSPERVHDLNLEGSIMKPGDIRYTKAGKKRTKSLEESLAISRAETLTTTSVAFSSADVPSTSKQFSSPLRSDALSLIQSSPVPIVSVQPLSVLPEGTIQSANYKASIQVHDMTKASNEKEVAPGGPIGERTIKKEPDANQTFSTTQPPGEKQQGGLTLSSLAEVASALSSTDAGDDAISSEVMGKLNAEGQKKSKSSTKDTTQKKKEKEKKSGKSKPKKSTSKSKRKDSKKNSNIHPHRPIPPSKMKPSLEAGIASVPRHGVVSLADMGMDRSETYGPMEIGDNNKIITPNMAMDGVTELEQLLEQQKRDSMEFFRDFGTTPDVAALMQTLHKVREENEQLQSAIDLMSRRRDQLQLMRTKICGLQTPTTPDASTHPTQEQHQAAPPKLPEDPSMPHPSHVGQSSYATQQTAGYAPVTTT